MSRFDPATARPREVEAYLREAIRRLWGDDVENNANIFASHGYYSINIPRPNDFSISFGNFRKKRAKEIVGYLKILRESQSRGE